jgi:hypothetical protein
MSKLRVYMNIEETRLFEYKSTQVIVCKRLVTERASTSAIS